MDRWNLQCKMQTTRFRYFFSFSQPKKSTSYTPNLNLLNRNPDGMKSKIGCSSFIQNFCPNAKVFDMAQNQFMNMCAECWRTATVALNAAFDTMHMYKYAFRSHSMCMWVKCWKLKWTAVNVPFLVMHSHKNFNRIRIRSHSVWPLLVAWHMFISIQWYFERDSALHWFTSKVRNNWHLFCTLA